MQRYRSSSRGRDRSETPPHWRREQQRARLHESRSTDQSHPNDQWARGDNEDKGRHRDLRDRFERSDPTGRSERTEKNEKAERSDKTDRSEKAERSDKTDRSEKAERSDKTDRSEKAERSDKEGGRLVVFF